MALFSGLALRVQNCNKVWTNLWNIKKSSQAHYNTYIGRKVVLLAQELVQNLKDSFLENLKKQVNKLKTFPFLVNIVFITKTACQFILLYDQDVGRGVELTKSVTNVIKIEKGDLSFGTINPQTNTIYLSYRDLNLVLAVDVTTKVITQIPIVKPKYMQINPETNMVYVIANGKVSVIDGKTNKKVKEIQENAHFARFLSINPLTNLLYVSYNNGSDKSRKKNPIDKVVVFDGTTLLKIKEINKGLKEPEGLAVDPQSNRIFVTNSKTSTISVLDGISNNVIDQIEIPREKLGWLSSSWQRLNNIILINNKTKLLYVIGTVGSSGPAGRGEQFCLFVVSINDKRLIKRLTLDGSASDICSSVGFNHQNNCIYIRRPSKNAILIMDEFAETNREPVELIKMGFLKKIFSEKPDPIIVNPYANKVYQTEGKLGLLLEMDG